MKECQLNRSSKYFVTKEVEVRNSFFSCHLTPMSFLFLLLDYVSVQYLLFFLTRLDGASPTQLELSPVFDFSQIIN